MARLALAWIVVTAFALLPGRLAHGAVAPLAPPLSSLILAADTKEMPPPEDTEEPGAAGTRPRAGQGELPVVGAAADEGPGRPADLSYGVAGRLRWVTVPRFLLNLFTKQNVPLSSWATAAEVFRRKGDFEFVFSIGYQNMTPGDGNWLGKTNPASTDTDFVQIRGLGFLGLDASFVWHTWFNEWFGAHYGAGLGIGKVFGNVYRTSNDPAICNDANAGNFTQCHPRGVDPNSNVTIDRQLQNLGTGPDDPNNPHRFADSNVPGFIPIVNIQLGIDFRLPQVRGWVAKLEGGFYDAFFLGGGVGYTF